MMKKLLPSWARTILRSRKATTGMVIASLFILMALFANQLAPYNPARYVGKPNQPPSAKHWFGTSAQGHDIFSRIVIGSRMSLGVGIAAGILMTLVGLVIGMSAGYFGGWIDDLFSLITNIFLVLPGIPLLAILAAFLKPGPVSVIFVLTLTSWAWPARVFRAMTLSLREKDFVAAALVSGENQFTIIFREILPNMLSLAVAACLGAITAAVSADAGLAFLGLENVSTVSWGMVLYWAQNGGSLLRGAWWNFVPAGLCLALFAFSLVLINYGLDEITNPRLRAEKEISGILRQFKIRRTPATPVVREAA